MQVVVLRAHGCFAYSREIPRLGVAAAPVICSTLARIRLIASVELAIVYIMFIS